MLGTDICLYAINERPPAVLKAFRDHHSLGLGGLNAVGWPTNGAPAMPSAPESQQYILPPCGLSLGPWKSGASTLDSSFRNPMRRTDTMTLGEDLQHLADLHQRGALSDDEFRRAKERLLNAPGPIHGGAPGRAQAAINALHRSRHDRWLGGVCGGITQVTGVATWFWRFVFVLLASFAGTGVLLYLLAWLLLPAADGPVEAPQALRPS
jgi:phage shock protein PspC (stress-responsive transcriptional regulator)